MKHPSASPAGGSPSPPPPEAAREVFGTALPVAVRYRDWLAGAGVQRGLIGPREVDRLWQRHLLNCAAVIDFLPTTGPIIDLGSGAGLPGIVVALLRPDLEVILLEPLLRRSTFLDEVVADLALPRVQVVRARAQEFAQTAPGTATAVTARAVAPLERLAQWAVPLLAPGGRLVALKGESAADEVASSTQALARRGLSVRAPHPVAIGDTVTFVVCAERAGAAANPRAEHASTQKSAPRGSTHRAKTRGKRR